MSKRPFDGARAAKRTLAITATAALAVTGAAFGSAATANAQPAGPSLVLGYQIGHEDPTTGYPSNTWFTGDQSTTEPGAGLDLAAPGPDLVLKPNTQLLTEIPGVASATPSATNLADFVAGGLSATTDPTSANPGTATLQIALFYGTDPAHPIFTTLHPSNVITSDTEALNTSDDWTSSQPIAVGDSTVLSGPLSTLIGDIEADGAQLVVSYGVFSDDGVTTALKSVTYGGEVTDFGNDGAAALNPTTTVIQKDALGQEDATATPPASSYPANPWFFGHNTVSPVTTTTVTKTGDLSAPSGAQLLHQLPDPASHASATNLADFIDNGLSVKVGAGSASLQIALFYGSDPTNPSFTTLHPLDAADTTAHYSQKWISTGTIPGVTLDSDGADTLGDLVSHIEAAAPFQAVIAYGAFFGPATTVTSFQAGTAKTTFADTKVITISTPTITGQTGPDTSIGEVPKVGDTLTAHFTVTSPQSQTGDVTTYQWYKGSAKITSGGTSSTYTITAASLVGQNIHVVVTVSKAGQTAGKGTSAATAKVVAGTLTGSVVVNHPDTVAGSFAVGQKLTAVVTSPTGTPAYTWYRSSTKISGATKSTYTPTSADLGKDVHVHVTLSKSGYTSLAVTSTPELIQPGMFETAPSLSGTLKVGSTLTARINATVGSVTGVYYEFVSIPAGATNDDDGILVQSGTSKTYKLTSSERGTTIEVFALASAPGYLVAAGISAPTGVIK